jgi:GT2 family glycosyltransferase
MLLDLIETVVDGESVPDLSIIIVNFNAEKLILRCLQAVYNTIGDAHCEVIVVDNASTDNSAAAVERDYPEVRLLRNTENVGFARANNQALQLARGRYFLLLNSDAFLHDGAIPRLIEYMDANPDIGASGCRLFYEDGALQGSCFSFPTPLTELWQALWLDRLFPSSHIFGRFRLSYWGFDSYRDVDWVMGAVMMVRRESLLQVGLFDEEYFMYSEEMDLCFRLKKAGWRISFIPEVTATHIWGGTSRQNKELAFIRLYKSRVLFSRKHYGPLPTLLYKLVLFGGSLTRVLGGSLAGMVKKNTDIQHGTRNYWILLRLILTI